MTEIAVCVFYKEGISDVPKNLCHYVKTFLENIQYASNTVSAILSKLESIIFVQMQGGIKCLGKLVCKKMSQ